MEVQVNGQWRAFPDGSTVADVMRAIDAPDRGVAVALDGEVVRRGTWAQQVVPAGARLEILTAVQGG
ncbi:sulfur carrier protein ThiS [Amycolatopsis viridis]|uniref:Sulfur carrier protein n=1 Tax=Amycolatopsis viridis TaxID=185678 RepID=A0ABX0SSC3_9PSEU|nr:sulfur carrier protein ThiS [Amycolatopsis viridis]NIH78246.1 sulfur carrier protein [Amycolatopsis viridis]